MQVESSVFKKQDDAPGKSISVTGQGVGGKSDEAELYQTPGILGRPEGEEICAVIEVGEQKIIVGTQNYKIGKSIDKGELFLYSVVNGVVKSSILLNKDGELIFNEGTDFAVKFNELKAGFDLLKTELNALVTAYSAHTHFVNALPSIPPAGIPSQVAIPSGVPATATIDSSKVDTVKLP